MPPEHEVAGSNPAGRAYYSCRTGRPRSGTTSCEDDALAFPALDPVELPSVRHLAAPAVPTNRSPVDLRDVGLPVDHAVVIPLAELPSRLSGHLPGALACRVCCPHEAESTIARQQAACSVVVRCSARARCHERRADEGKADDESHSPDDQFFPLLVRIEFSKTNPGELPSQSGRNLQASRDETHTQESGGRTRGAGAVAVVPGPSGFRGRKSN